MLVKMIQDNFNHLREDMNNRFDRFEKKFESIEKKLETYCTIEDCKKNRKSCIENLELKKSELSIKKITAIGGVFTGSIAACSAIIITLIKLCFPI